MRAMHGIPQGVANHKHPTRGCHVDFPARKWLVGSSHKGLPSHRKHPTRGCQYGRIMHVAPSCEGYHTASIPQGVVSAITCRASGSQKRATTTQASHKGLSCGYVQCGHPTRGCHNCKHPTRGCQYSCMGFGMLSHVVEKNDGSM